MFPYACIHVSADILIRVHKYTCILSVSSFTWVWICLAHHQPMPPLTTPISPHPLPHQSRPVGGDHPQLITPNSSPPRTGRCSVAQLRVRAASLGKYYLHRKYYLQEDARWLSFEFVQHHQAAPSRRGCYPPISPPCQAREWEGEGRWAIPGGELQRWRGRGEGRREKYW
jgi:hypothetical protein